MCLLEDGVKHAKKLFTQGSENLTDEMNVIGRYSQIFNLKTIQDMTWEQLYGFTLWRNNKHWTNLHRGNSKLKNSFEEVKGAIRQLLNEDISITDRLNLTIPSEAKYKAEGLGPAIVTAILTVAFPDKYMVFNNTVIAAINALQEMGEIDTGLGEIKKYKFTEQYEPLNRLVVRIAKKYGLSLWQIDWVWFYVIDFLKENKSTIPTPGPEIFLDGNDDEEPSNPFASYLPTNIILYGPVGTGKTTFARLIARGIAGGSILNLQGLLDLIKGDDLSTEADIKIDDKIEIVTFHKSYGYEQFVEGLRPSKDEAGHLVYKYTPGVFKRFSDKALARLKSGDKTNYVLVIDEINRGDISRIFGELITLVEKDKRYFSEHKEGMKIALPYSGEYLIVPKNLYIIGTMNTTDKSIALIDLALRRRFYFVEVLPDWEKLQNALDAKLKEADLKNAILILAKRLNEEIESLRGEDFGIGQAYYLNINNEDDFLHTWVYRIMPLLQEYFYDEPDVLLKLLGRVIKLENNGNNRKLTVKEYKELNSKVFIDSILNSNQMGASTIQ